MAGVGQREGSGPAQIALRLGQYGKCPMVSRVLGWGQVGTYHVSFQVEQNVVP